MTFVWGVLLLFVPAQMCPHLAYTVAPLQVLENLHACSWHLSCALVLEHLASFLLDLSSHGFGRHRAPVSGLQQSGVLSEEVVVKRSVYWGVRDCTSKSYTQRGQCCSFMGSLNFDISCLLNVEAAKANEHVKSLFPNSSGIILHITWHCFLFCWIKVTECPVLCSSYTA